MGEHSSAPNAVRLRDVHRYGLNRGHIRRIGWERLSQGLHARVVPERSQAQLAELMTAVLPRDSGFGHLTSASLRGWWLPNRLPSFVTLASTTSGVHIQRRGLYVRRSRYAEFETLAGLRLVTAAQTLVELARDLSLIDLVPMVDAALAHGTEPDEILAAIRPRGRGAAVLRRAVGLADKRSESWWESMLRLQHSLTGLGPVACQVEIWDDDAFVARADLHLVGTTRFPECDGGEHRTRGRHAHDLTRDKAIGRMQLERYGYTTDEIARRPEMIIRDGETARGLRHDPGRLQVWWRYARLSTLTAHGRSRLQGRLERYRLAAEHPVASSGRFRRADSGQNSPLDGGG